MSSDLEHESFPSNKPKPLVPSHSPRPNNELEAWVYDKFSVSNTKDVIEFFEEVGVQHPSDFKYLARSDIDRSTILKPCAKNILRTTMGFNDETLDGWVRSRFDNDDALSIMDLFKSLGVKTVDDLKYLKRKDVTNSNLLKVVKRKLREAVSRFF